MKLILGYSKTGQSVERFLKKHNEDFVIYDDKNPVDLPAYDMVIKSPGVPLSHPLCQGKKVINEFDLFKPKARVIAITGSSGKTTMATLIHAFLEKNNIETALGGNIGTPILDLPELSKNGIYVLEMSSFNLETAPTLPIDIGILLNFMPNHLDRHGTMEDYLKAKMNIFKHARVGVLPSVILSSAKDLLKDEILHAVQNDDPQTILTKIADILHLPHTHIAFVIKEFKPLEHRLEKILEKDNVIYINDSKATTFFSVAYGIEKTKDLGEIHLIMGGLLKEDDPSYLLPFLKNVRQLYIFGADRLKIQKMLCEPSSRSEAQSTENPGSTQPLMDPGSLAFAKSRDDAFKMISENCQIFDTIEDVLKNLKFNPSKKSVVLFSPGGASFDQYKNYIDRGEAFKKYYNFK